MRTSGKKNMKWIVQIVVVAVVGLLFFAVGTSSRADIDSEALTSAQKSVDALAKALESPQASESRGALSSFRAVESAVHKLSPADQEVLKVPMQDLKRVLRASQDFQYSSRELKLDQVSEAAVSLRSVRSSMRAFQVSRESPTFFQALGRDLRTLISSFSSVGALTLVAICVIVYAVFSEPGRSHVKSLIVSIGTLKLGSLELTFRGSGREATVAQIMGLSRDLNANFLGHSTNSQLLQRLEQVLTSPSVVEALGKPCSAINDFRAVIHMPDPLLSRTFFQATSYWPLNHDLSKRAGRRRSMHFGAIGRAWTDLDKSSIAQNVDGDLVQMYNMAPTEAADRREKSYAVICLPGDKSKAKAVLYMDSSEADQFPADVTALAEAIRSAASLVGLSDAIERIHQEMSCANPIISIHEDADATL